MRTALRCVASAACILGFVAPRASAQTATWYISTYTSDMLVWDEATEEIIDRIRMNRPIPNGVQLNEAMTRLYVGDASGQHIQIVDIALREVIDEITLTHDSVVVRIDGFAAHPSDRRAVMLVKNYTKLIDRYSVEGPFLVAYDLETKQVTDTLPWPEGGPSERTNFRFSPDGEVLYFFTSDIIAVDADTYEEVDRWELSQPLEPGLGRPNFGTNSNTYDEPGVATSLIRIQDPVHNRSLMGIARARLSDKVVDFFTLGPSEPVGSFVLAPGGEKAYALYTTIGAYEFWEFDLVNERVSRRVPFPGRARMGLGVSADGTKIYVHVAGNTIDVYDAATFSLMRTVEFDEDMTLGNVAIIPGNE
ncbi:MAG: hypothetical protein O2958_03350 [Gemmatimonadetes bacterium]|nr:hypothetical protein [Gemmatimonadota bacterium]MDA1102356.1 hypothetical protein [Gemmatimonadota bacterium]